MLLHVQKPGSVYVASAYDWMNRFGRRPKPGASPLVILRPFGPVAFVYELSDTEGKEFPKKMEKPFFAAGDISDRGISLLEQSMYYEAIKTTVRNYGTNMAGGICAIREIGEFKTATASKPFRLIFGMLLNNKLPNAAKAATIFHELGHAFCGHLHQPNAKWIPCRPDLMENEMEFEAESVCWLMCERLGIDNPSADISAAISIITAQYRISVLILS